MFRYLVVILVLGLPVAAASSFSYSSDLEKAREHMPLILADLHFAERNCPTFYVDRGLLDNYAEILLGKGNIGEEPHQTVYLERSAQIASFMLSERLGAICGEIWNLYGPSSELSGFTTLLPHIRLTPADTYVALMDHFQFDVSGYESAIQSRMHSALRRVFDACPGLDNYTEVISAESIEYVDYGYGYSVDYDGAREPWGPMFRAYFKVADHAEGVPSYWVGHTFGVYVKGDMSELVSTKRVGNELCGLDGIGDNVDRVVFLR